MNEFHLVGMAFSKKSENFGVELFDWTSCSCNRFHDYFKQLNPARNAERSPYFMHSHALGMLNQQRPIHVCRLTQTLQAAYAWWTGHVQHFSFHLFLWGWFVVISNLPVNFSQKALMEERSLEALVMMTFSYCLDINSRMGKIITSTNHFAKCAR